MTGRHHSTAELCAIGQQAAKRYSKLAAAVAVCLISANTANAYLLHRSTFDNASVGAGAGTDTTASGTFSIGAAVGTVGVAGGTANTTPGATIAPNHLTSGASGIAGQSLSLPSAGAGDAGVRFNNIAPPGSGDYSVSIWFNYEGVDVNAYVASNGNSGSTTEGWSIFRENTNVIFRAGFAISSAGNDLRASVGSPYTLDSNWHHAVLVIDSNGPNQPGVIQGYLDGVAGTVMPVGGPPDNTFVSDTDGILPNPVAPTLLGVRSTGTFNFPGNLDEFQVYDTALTPAQVLQLFNSPGSTISTPGSPTALINRDTGNLSLIHAGDPLTIVGYRVLSSAGALNPSNATWLSIAEHYDRNGGATPGNGFVDANDDWVELTSPSVNTDLSELEPNGDGAAFNGGKVINLGNAWIKSPTEDVTCELLLADGSVRPIEVNVTGTTRTTPYAFGDLDTDGDIDFNDFQLAFLPNYGANTSSILSSVRRYRMGDLNNSGSITLEDFLLLNAAYRAAHPGAGSLAFPGEVPEPTTFSLLAMPAGMLFLRTRRRRRRTSSMNLLPNRAAIFSTAVMALVTIAWTPPAGAVALLLNSTFNNADVGAGLGTDTTAAGTFVVKDTAGAPENGTAGGTANTTPGTTTTNHLISGVAGQIGQAIQITGTGNTGETGINYGNVHNPGLNPYSVSLWFNFNGARQDGMLASKGNSGSGVQGWSIFQQAGNMIFRLSVNASGATDRAGVNITAPGATDNAWHHAVLGIDTAGGVVRGYLDGVAATTAGGGGAPGQTFTMDGDGITSATSMLVGVRSTTGFTFKGLLDDFAIVDSLLSQAQVTAIYNAGLAHNGIATVIGSGPPTTLSLDVSTSTGQIKLRNDSLSNIEIDAYRITGPANSLVAANWTSLDDQNYDNGPPEPGDFNGDGKFDAADYVVWRNNGLSLAEYNQWRSKFGSTSAGTGKWTELGHTDIELSEGAFGASSILIAGMTPIILGNAFNTAASVGGLTFQYHVVGTSASSFVNGIITPVSGAGFGAAVPEPTTGLLMLVSVSMTLMLSSRCRRAGKLSAAPVLMLLLLSRSVTAATNDRDYTLGDDLAEGASANATVGSFTYDTAGTPGQGNLQDLTVVGSPVYRTVSGGTGRPGAAVGSLGIEFNGTSDYLHTPISMNAPSEMWDNATFFPPAGTVFPFNYESIFSHGMQLWAKPTTTSARQDIVLDTAQHGIFISATNTWGLQFNGTSVDSGVTVASTLNPNGWVHVMEVTEPGGSAYGGALLVNGVAVTARASVYAAATTELTIGANLAGTGNYYKGILDNMRLFLWGNNSFQLGADNAAGGTNSGAGLNADGQNWGTLSLDATNDWIAQKLASLGVTSVADVNLNGVLAGDGTGPAATDDVTAFMAGWNSIRTVSGLQVGDWVSRQNGDLNYDGAVNLYDAYMLRTALLGSGTGSFDIGRLLDGSVPEPSSIILSLMAVGACALVSRCRRAKSIRIA